MARGKVQKEVLGYISYGTMHIINIVVYILHCKLDMF